MRPIDADAWTERIDSDHCASCSRLCPCSECGLGIARESIENTPTLDAVPVVRCKNCKYWEQDEDEPDYGICKNFDGYGMKADDYCSYAEWWDE